MVNTQSVNIALLFCISRLKYLKTTCWQIDGCWCKNGGKNKKQQKDKQTPRRDCWFWTYLSGGKREPPTFTSSVSLRCSLCIIYSGSVRVKQCSRLSKQSWSTWRHQSETGDSRSSIMDKFSAKKMYLFLLFKLCCVGQKIVTTASRPTVWAVHLPFSVWCSHCCHSNTHYIFSNISSFPSLITEYVHFIEEQAEERVTRPG